MAETIKLLLVEVDLSLSVAALLKVMTIYMTFQELSRIGGIVVKIIQLVVV